MKLSEYQDLYRRLSTAEDIDFLAENFGHDKELLLVIYTQRIVRETTKKFYRVKAQARRLAFMWQNGASLLEIARKFEFPPILTALMVLEQRKISRKQFWKMINDLDSVKDRRLRQELADVNGADIVYSTQGSARQYARGRWGEAKLHTWLDARSLQYETEKDLRSKYDKTPDILLHKPIEMNGSRKFWIESKATFGDPYEIRRHLRKQLQPYSDLFGDGAVVYWFGHVDDQKYELPEGVDIVSPTFFETPPLRSRTCPWASRNSRNQRWNPTASAIDNEEPETFKSFLPMVTRVAEEEVVRVRMPRGKDGEILGIADQLLGASRIRVMCQDGKSRLGRIPGKLKKRMWIREGDLLVVKVWQFQDEKCDIKHRYTKTESTYMSRRGLIPKSINIF